MTNSYKEYSLPYNNVTSARKVALSLILYPYKDGQYEKDIDIGMDYSATDASYYGGNQLEQAAFHEDSYATNIKRLEKEINILNQKMEQNDNALYDIQSYIIELNKQKKENNVGQFNTQPLRDVLNEWLLKRMIILVSGSYIEGVLTEVTADCVKLVEAEYIVVIPLSKIDFIKLPL